MIIALLYLALIVLTFAGYWKMFEKANRPGWTSLIPIYNIVVCFEIIGKPLWQLILFFVPVANIYVLITMITGMCKSYGKPGMANYMAALFLGFIYFPYLGFSDDVKYVGPAKRVAQPQAV
jgi:hypothetical protein